MTEGTTHSEAPLRPKLPLYVQILGAMALGLVVGPMLGQSADQLGELGKLVIQLIKAAATPLLFLAIVRSILETEIEGRAALRLLFWASVNASIALTIGLLISNVFQPGQALSEIARPSMGALAAYENKKIDLESVLGGIVPSSFVTPFADNIVLSIVLLSLFTGFALRRVRGEQAASGEQGARVIEGVIVALLRMMEVVLGWVIKLIPLAVFGVVAKSVGQHGYAPLQGLAVYVAVGVGGLALHILLTYHAWLLIFARMSWRTFWREAREPVIYAAGANSSLATLPVTLRALDRLGVPRSASTLGACVGTNFNNDGILLYEGMAVLFVAQASGIDLSLSQQLVVALTCMVAAMGVAGVPEAGFISLALVLNTVGLPVEILPLLLTVDWIIARGRSITNVLSDMLLSILVARGERERGG
jgi:DAACS family dicarboxylate/amino acid:cation (Na+ or H+) symporter